MRPFLAALLVLCAAYSAAPAAAGRVTADAVTVKGEMLSGGAAVYDAEIAARYALTITTVGAVPEYFDAAGAIDWTQAPDTFTVSGAGILALDDQGRQKPEDGRLAWSTAPCTVQITFCRTSAALRRQYRGTFADYPLNSFTPDPKAAAFAVISLRAADGKEYLANWLVMPQGCPMQQCDLGLYPGLVAVNVACRDRRCVFSAAGVSGELVVSQAEGERREEKALR